MSKIVQQKPLIICGPTGSGKTALATKLAQKYDGELISADSRQVYRYLNIGTNKGPVVENTDGSFSLASIKLHLVNILNPDQVYSVRDFVEAAEAQIADCLSRNKLPIVVGGTGLYLDALIRGYSLSTEAIDLELRAKLNSLGLTDLQAQVHSADLAQLNSSDRQNPRRLIRLIERQASSQYTKIGGKYSYQIIFLDKEIAAIEQDLKQRVSQMWQAGIVAEVQAVIAQGFSADSVALQGIGYRDILRYLDKQITDTQCQELIYLAHRQYAKRQLTWFHKFLARENISNTTSALLPSDQYL